MLEVFGHYVCVDLLIEFEDLAAFQFGDSDVVVHLPVADVAVVVLAELDAVVLVVVAVPFAFEHLIPVVVFQFLQTVPVWFVFPVSCLSFDPRQRKGELNQIALVPNRSSSLRQMLPTISDLFLFSQAVKNDHVVVNEKEGFVEIVGKIVEEIEEVFVGKIEEKIEEKIEVLFVGMLEEMFDLLHDLKLLSK